MEKVIITVRDGVAQVEEKPKDIKVQIIDYDYLGRDDRLVADPLSTDKELLCCVVTEYE